MGKTKMTKEEKIQSLHRRVTTEQERLLLGRCKMALDLHSNLIVPVWDLITSHGITAAALDASQKVPKTSQAKAMAKKRSMEKAALAAHPDPADVIDTKKYPTLGSFTMKTYRKDLLPLVDPSAFSAANLAIHESKGGKEMYLQLLEYATGLGADFPLTPPNNSWSSLKDLIADQAAARAERVLGMVLPPQWSRQHGLYEIIGIEKDELLVKHRFLSMEYKIGVDKLPSFKSVDELYIDKGFSEERACIASKRCSDPRSRFVLSRVCSEHTSAFTGSPSKQPILETPRRRKRKLAASRSSSVKKADPKAKLSSDEGDLYDNDQELVPVEPAEDATHETNNSEGMVEDESSLAIPAE